MPERRITVKSLAHESQLQSHLQSQLQSQLQRLFIDYSMASIRIYSQTQVVIAQWLVRWLATGEVTGSNPSNTE